MSSSASSKDAAVRPHPWQLRKAIRNWGALKSGAWALAALALLVGAVIIVPGIKEPFRLPKLLASESLSLLSLLLLGLFALRRTGLRLSALRQSSAVWTVAPLVLVACLSSLLTSHTAHTSEALFSLLIGALALVGWSLWLPARRQLVNFMLVPGAILAVGVLLQLAGFAPRASVEGNPRLSLTSLAGSVGELGGYLVLPCLIAQVGAFRAASNRGRTLLALVAVVTAAGCVVTQTLTALLALAVSSLVLWAVLVPKRARIQLIVATVLFAVFAVVAFEPLQDRVLSKAEGASQGRLNELVSGRLDGWKAALHMFFEHPLTGVGHGAYVTEFAEAKLDIIAAEGSESGRLLHRFPMFGNAHNEYLEVAAELGLPGLIVLAWALYLLVARLRAAWLAGEDKFIRSDTALAIAGVLALALLSAAYFPFRIALTGYAAVGFLAWILSPELPGDGVSDGG